MTNLVVNLKSKLNRPLSRRAVSIWLGGIIVLQAVMFFFAYQSDYNPVRAVNNQIPYVLPPSEPTELTQIYGQVGSPLVKPMAIAVVNRRIYVSDTNNHRIQVFDYDGHPVLTFGSPGNKPGQFSFPYGIAGDSQGQIYVADLYNGNVSVFDQDGKFVKYFGDKGKSGKPAGLAIDGDKLYLADAGKNQISIYALEGKKLLSFGKPGSGQGEISSPNCLTHANGKIYVSDTGNDRVVVFDDQGKFLNQFDGRTAEKNYSLIINPRGIGIDPKGIVYVVSNLTSKVQGFNPKGEAVVSFGGAGSEDGQFQLPNGLAVDDQGRIYITDTVNGRIAVYQN